MKIIVCIKQVPDTTEVKLDPKTGRLIRDGVPSIINPDDKNALEEALRIKDENPDTTVTVVSMGPPQADVAMREALAMGADEAILISGREFGGSDTWATSYIIATAIKKIPDYDIIFCGRQAIDGDTAQVGAELAEQLGIAQLTAVCDLPEIKGVYIEALIDCDSEQRLMQASLPALLTVGRTPYELRFASIGGVIEANRNDTIKTLTKDMLPEIDAAMIGLDGSPTRTADTFVPERSSGAKFIEGGTTEEAAETLAAMLRRGTV